MRFGVPRGFFKEADAEVVAAVDAALDVMRGRSWGGTSRKSTPARPGAQVLGLVGNPVPRRLTYQPCRLAGEGPTTTPTFLRRGHQRHLVAGELMRAAQRMQQSSAAGSPRERCTMWTRLVPTGVSARRQPVDGPRRGSMRGLVRPVGLARGPCRALALPCRSPPERHPAVSLELIGRRLSEKHLLRISASPTSRQPPGMPSRPLMSWPRAPGGAGPVADAEAGASATAAG